MWQVTPVASIYAIAVIICLLTAIRAWRYRATRGARVIALIMLANIIWAACYALGVFSTDLVFKKNMIRLEYIGIVSVPYLFFLFSLAYTSYERWLTRTTVIALAVIPVIVLLLAWTHDLHPLIYQSLELTTVNGLVVTSKTYGPAFWLLTAYSYILVFLGAFFLISDVLRHPRMFQGQTALMLIAALIPGLVNLTTITGLNRLFSPYDASSLAFTVTGLLMLLGMTRFKLLNLVPVAHDLVFMNVTSGVVVLNAEGRILELNPAAEQILGRAQNEVTGKLAPEVFPEHRDLIAQFAEVNETRTQITLGANPRIYDMQIAPLYHRSRARGVFGRIILLADITEREQLIAELNAYAHTVAHDLKTPISAMQGYAQLLNMSFGDSMPEGAQRMTARIINSSAKMTSIIDSLLLLAALRRSDEVQMSEVDMRAVVADSISRLDQRIQETNAVIVQPDAWPEAARVCSFAPWLEEIWVNYIGNALKYGGTPPRVEIGATLLLDQRVRFWVKDNGRGLTDDEKASLFTEFSRLAQHSGTEGHGLGLSIVQRIAARLGGTVGVESKLGEGSSFYFTLPALPVSAALPTSDAEPIPA